MTNPSAGDTVSSTKWSRDFCVQSKRKRRRLEPFTGNVEIPEKTQRREEQPQCDARALSPEPANLRNETDTNTPRPESDASCYVKSRWNRDATTTERGTSKVSTNKPAQQQESRRPITIPVRDEAARLRKTIQWLEEGARRLREDLANARTELHEERRAAKVARRKTEAAIREARSAEATKYQLVIIELKAKLARASPVESSSSICQASVAAAKAEFIREEHHKREISALKKRLSEAEGTVRRLKWESLNFQTKNNCKSSGSFCPEIRRLELELRNLRATNEKLEEKLRIAQEAEKARIAELRIQHENHETELSSLRKSLRTETMKMMDELRGKNREIEKLSKLRQTDGQWKRRKTSTPKDDATMRKLRENERNGPIRPASRMGKKFLLDDAHTMDSYIPEEDCDRVTSEIEVERLRELALEQQEVIEVLRQAVKEKERKLEQLSNKRRKEEFYRQWLELEPVAEVEDEEDHEDHEEGDSALSSGPSSLSPQPSGYGQWHNNDITREAYEAVLLEVEELQAKLLYERQELQVARSHARDLEKALLQESRCESPSAELNALAEKLRAAEEREAALLVDLSELREQNELLEFRLLELEETSARRGSPDRTADSGIVSPEPLHTSKDQLNKHRNRAIATVIPYTNSANLNRSASPVPNKPPLSLQESGIFEEEVEDVDELEVEHASRGTQTEPLAGELHQEVQRLQELRLRIQERAAKFANNPMLCPIEQNKSNPALETVNDVSVYSLAQLSSYQERVRDLEERLEIREKEVDRRLQEKELSKQREEELLDENYRLTERVYWLESELKHTREKIVENSKVQVQDSGVQAETIQIEEEDISDDVRQEHAPDNIRNGTPLLQVEYSKSSNHPSKAVQTEINLSGSLSCCVSKSHGPIALGSGSTKWTAQKTEDSIMIVEEIAREVREDEDGEEDARDQNTDEVDAGAESLARLSGNVSQVLVVPEEATLLTETPVEPMVSLIDPDPEKKVRHRKSMFKEREGWAMKTWNLNRIRNTKGDTCLQQRNCRLVVYQEICV